MNVVVFVSGIADPRKPLTQPLSLESLRSARSAQALLSPFDEAALEIALKLRDADPDVRITALVAGRDPTDPLLRSVSSLRIDIVRCIATASVAVWDAAAFASALAEVARRSSPDVALFLVGREFGDFDDGTLPAMLAERLGCNYASLVTAADRHDGRLRLVRHSQGTAQRFSFTVPVLASITNDAGNRLRQPLLKNVMAARKATFEAFVPEESGPDGSRFTAATASVPDRRGERCRVLAGHAREQAMELSALLLDQPSCS